jgi:hypothetical protein
MLKKGHAIKMTLKYNMKYNATKKNCIPYMGPNPIWAENLMYKNKS